MRSATLHKVSTSSELPTKDKKEGTTKSAWETILNAGKGDDANRVRTGVEDKQVEPGPALEDDDHLIATALQEVIANEVKSQVTNALGTIADMVEESVEQRLCAATLSAQMGICSVLYDAVEHGILD